MIFFCSLIFILGGFPVHFVILTFAREEEFLHEQFCGLRSEVEGNELGGIISSQKAEQANSLFADKEIRAARAFGALKIQFRFYLCIPVIFLVIGNIKKNITQNGEVQRYTSINFKIIRQTCVQSFQM